MRTSIKAKLENTDTVMVFMIIIANGGRRFIIWNQRTGFQQRCRKEAIALKIARRYNVREPI